MISNAKVGRNGHGMRYNLSATIMFPKHEGHKVKILGKTGIKFCENNKIMLIDSEMLSGPDHDIAIYRDSIQKWNPPHDGDVLTSGDKDRIMKAITRSLSKLRIDWA